MYKKVIILGFAIILGLSWAEFSHASTYNQTITLNPGWNIISTPRLVESHSFSAAEISSNFDIYTLNPASVSKWSTMAELSQTEFTPLFGYFINNKTGANQTLILNYKDNVNPNERLFERTLAQTGWYSIGPANPTYIKTICGSTSDTNNVSKIIDSLSGKYSSVVDFTDSSFLTSPNSVLIGDVWKSVISSDVNQLNDLRELKGYAIYINSTNALYSGFQNINSPDACQPAQGQITVSQASNTPTGNVAKGATAATLAKFTIYAAGEAVKVKFLTFKLTFTGGKVAGATLTTFPAALASSTLNINMTDAAGGQIGTTINTPPTSNSCDNNGTAATAGWQSSDLYIDCFGTATSPVNYIVPANTTRVLSLKADIGANAAFTTVTGSLTGNSSNLQGLTSSASNSSGGASGSALTLSSSSLTAAANSALGTQSIPKNSTAQKIGSYALTASSADGVVVSNISITNNLNGIQNEKLMVNGVQFGNTQPTAGASSTYAFSGSPFTISAGGTTYVDVYADTLSSFATQSTAATTLASCTGSGQTTYNAVSCNINVAGQGVMLSGQSSITITADSSQAPAGQIVMGATQAPLATFRFTETTNSENVKVTDLTVTNLVVSTTTVKSNFLNLTLYNGNSPLGTAGAASTASATPAYQWSFHFGTPFTVPQANSLSLVLKGDMASWTSSGVADNTTGVFKILLASDVTALGSTSNATSGVTLSSANGNAQTALRSKLAFSATSLGSVSARSKQTADNLATLSFAANSAGTVALNTLVVTFSGNGLSSSNFWTGVKILDENNVSQGTVVATSSVTCGQTNGGTSTSTCAITFNFGSTTSGQQVSAGQTRNWTLVIDDTKTQASAGTNVTALSAYVNAQSTDVLYTDALDGSASSNVTLPSSQLFPIPLNSISFVQGT